MTDNWTDSLAGARMQVDQQFEPRVEASEFTSQEWGLIMTAVEFDVHEAGDPEAAELYADTDNLPQIVPELERIQREMGGSATPVEDSGSSGMFGKVRQMIDNLTADRKTSSDDERLRNAEVLVQDYADELQIYLEKQGRWDEIRQAAHASAEAGESEAGKSEAGESEAGESEAGEES